jgi:hypothetical protein
LPSWHITRTTVAPHSHSPPQAFQNYTCAMFGLQQHLQPAVMPSSFQAQDLLHCSFDAPKAHTQVVNSITYSMRSGHFCFEVEVNWGLTVEWRDWIVKRSFPTEDQVATIYDSFVLPISSVLLFACALGLRQTDSFRRHSLSLGDIAVQHSTSRYCAHRSPRTVLLRCLVHNCTCWPVVIPSSHLHEQDLAFLRSTLQAQAPAQVTPLPIPYRSSPHPPPPPCRPRYIYLTV